jgi:hypothetical protein
MTAMEDRKKFTYRYDDKTEKLLNEGLNKFNLSSLNKLIDKLILDALVRFPQDQIGMNHKISELQECLNKCEAKEEQTEIHLNMLPNCYKYRVVLNTSKIQTESNSQQKFKVMLFVKDNN